MAAVQPTSTNDLQGTQAERHADSQARREARDKDRKANEELFAKERAEMIKRNEEQMQAESKYRPTPTVEEVQSALAGHNKDNKEPDGSPLQNPQHPVVGAAQQIEVGREMPSAQPVPGGMTPEQQAEYDRKLASEHSKPAVKK